MIAEQIQFIFQILLIMIPVNSNYKTKQAIFKI
jgi:hypothetical protein